jgi:hypothetical protein
LVSKLREFGLTLYTCIYLYLNPVVKTSQQWINFSTGKTNSPALRHPGFATPEGTSMCLIGVVASSTSFLAGALPQTPRYFYNNGN